MAMIGNGYVAFRLGCSSVVLAYLLTLNQHNYIDTMVATLAPAPLYLCDCFVVFSIQDRTQFSKEMRRIF